MIYICTKDTNSSDLYSVRKIYTNINDLRKYFIKTKKCNLSPIIPECDRDYENYEYYTPTYTIYTHTKDDDDSDYDDDDFYNDDFYNNPNYNDYDDYKSDKMNAWILDKSLDYILDEIVFRMFPNWHTDVSTILELRLSSDIVSVIQKYIGPKLSPDK